MGHSTRPKAEPLTPTESALIARSEHVKATALPITDPFLAGVSEQLHRICDAQSLEVARWMAGDELVLLRNYVAKTEEQL